MACNCGSLKAEVLSQRQLMTEWFETLRVEIQDARAELVELIKSNTFNVGEQQRTTDQQFTGQQSSIVEPIPASAFLESNNSPLQYGDAVCDSNPVLLSPEPSENPEMEQPPDPAFENELILGKIEPRRAEEISVEFSITQNQCSDETFGEQTRATSELNQFCSVEAANINAAVKHKQVPVNKEESFSRNDSQKSVCQQPKNKRRMYRCSECPYEAFALSNVKKHALIHSEEKPFACDRCESRFTYKAHLLRHKSSHTGDKSFRCRLTGEKPFACNRCDFRTNRKYNLQTHQRTHTGKKTYHCGLCDFKSNRQSNFIYHKVLVHTEEKPLKCEFCDFRCIKITELVRHKRRHTGEKKPFACDQCAYTANTRSDLKRHQRRHTGEKPFACDQCDFRTIQKINLENHQRMHTGEKPFQCDFCDYRAASRPVIYYHTKSKHQGQA